MAVRSTSKGNRRLAVASLGLAFVLAGMQAVEARGHHHHAHRGGRGNAARATGGPAQSSSAFAALVIDVNTGRTLYADRENELRHPASITKVMTLYLLFEKLQAGEMTLDTRLTVSRHAASMSPTKLGLRPGSTIRTEDAIKAIVTKSANDMAVAVAEAIGGDEDSFARMMTRKAHALGMFRTTYVNASGLPDNRQITTARDLTMLGRAIQDNFPRYYHFFSTPSFTYAGEFMANHNHLMERVEGMDGIKTGYTTASGFNLLSNVNRDGHHIVAVVMGGKSAAGRDRIMEGLIAQHLEEAAPTRVAGRIEEEKPVEAPAATVSRAEDDVAETADDPHDQSPSLIAPTMAVRPAPVRRPKPTDRARPAYVAGASRPVDPEGLPPAMVGADRSRAAFDGSTNSRGGGDAVAVTTPATATPSSLRWMAGAQPAKLGPPAPTPVRPVRLASSDDTTDSIRPPVRPAAAQGRGDWVIQIGATESASEASQLLSRAKTDSGSGLGGARAVTEKVRKGRTTLYRARFAGLGPDQAQAACRTLKRSGFACFATKD